MTELDLSSLALRSVSTGEIKHVPLVLACSGLGIFFPGVKSCLPTVVWSPGVSYALAIHVGSPQNTPDELKRAIAQYENLFLPPGDSLHISATKVIVPEEDRIAHIKGREENLAFLSSLTAIKEIRSDSPLGENLSFRISDGFQVVRT